MITELNSLDTSKKPPIRFNFYKKSALTSLKTLEKVVNIMDKNWIKQGKGEQWIPDMFELARELDELLDGFGSIKSEGIKMKKSELVEFINQIIKEEAELDTIMRTVLKKFDVKSIDELTESNKKKFFELVEQMQIKFKQGPKNRFTPDTDKNFDPKKVKKFKKNEVTDAESAKIKIMQMLKDKDPAARKKAMAIIKKHADEGYRLKPDNPFKVTKAGPKNKFNWDVDPNYDPEKVKKYKKEVKNDK